MKKILWILYCTGVMLIFSSCGVSEKELNESVRKALPHFKKQIVISKINTLISKNPSHSAYMLSETEGILLSEGVFMLTDTQGKKIDLKDITPGRLSVVSRYYDAVRFYYKIEEKYSCKIVEIDHDEFSHSANLSVTLQRGISIKNNVKGTAVAFTLPPQYETGSGEVRFKWLNEKHIVNLPDRNFDYQALANTIPQYNKIVISENYTLYRNRETGNWTIQLKNAANRLSAGKAPWLGAVFTQDALIADFGSKKYIKKGQYFLHEDNLTEYNKIEDGFIYAQGKWYSKQTYRLGKACIAFVNKLSLGQQKKGFEYRSRLRHRKVQNDTNVNVMPPDPHQFKPESSRRIVSSTAVGKLLDAVKKNKQADAEMIKCTVTWLKVYLNQTFDLCSGRAFSPAVEKEFKDLVQLLRENRSLLSSALTDKWLQKYEAHIAAIRTSSFSRHNHTKPAEKTFRKVFYSYVVGNTSAATLKEQAARYPSITDKVDLFIEYNELARSTQKLRNLFYSHCVAYKRNQTVHKSYPFIKRCHSCNGKGYCACQNCGGTGTVRYRKFGDKKLGLSTRNCHICSSSFRDSLGGDGKVRCSTCGGNGATIHHDILRKRLSFLKRKILSFAEKR